MTRPSKKQEEKEILRALLCATCIQPERSAVEGEKPDFMVRISGRIVGVEVTLYRSDKTVARVGGRAVKRRAVESEWEHLERSSRSFRWQHADLQDVYILFRFKNAVPPQTEHDVFFQEVLQFVRLKRDALGGEGVAFWMPDFQSRLIGKYLKDLILSRGTCSKWDSNITYGFVDCPARNISKIVAEKTEAAIAYRPASEQWLVIAQNGRPSEMVLPINGAFEFETSPELKESLLSSPFSRVYVFTAMGLFQWDKGVGNWHPIAYRKTSSMKHQRQSSPRSAD
ncbi:MAG: hypothetical protein P4L40_03550 [Terracidiphilus sp.]|nr:hypothetical protein [Terracidiphilus sp.]